MSYLGVNVVGEVHRRCALGKANDFALRSEHIELFGADLIAQRLKELCGVRGLGLPV